MYTTDHQIRSDPIVSLGYTLGSSMVLCILKGCLLAKGFTSKSLTGKLSVIRFYRGRRWRTFRSFVLNECKQQHKDQAGDKNGFFSGVCACLYTEHWYSLPAGCLSQWKTCTSSRSQSFVCTSWCSSGCGWVSWKRAQHWSSLYLHQTGELKG